MTSGISAIAYYLPKNIKKSIDLEKEISQQSSVSINTGMIERITGIRQRYVSEDNEYNSTLAIMAVKKMFLDYKINAEDIDLLIFASTGQDVLEPATSHIIQKEIGTHCPVMDVTNACNSFLNSIEIANAFILSKKYKNILIASGEVPSKVAKTQIADEEDLRRSFPGFTFGDAGVAVLINDKSEIAEIIDSYFFADSNDWDVAMLPGGGSRYLKKGNSMFFTGNGSELAKPFFKHVPILMEKFLTQNNIEMRNISHFFIHQVSLRYLLKFNSIFGIDMEKVKTTIIDYGNIAAATIPLEIALSLEQNNIKSGDYGLCLGLAGGISIGFILIKFK